MVDCRTPLSPCGQHLGDVGEEGAVGSEDEESAALDALGVGVEEVRGPVQADRGLAGAGGSLHTDGGGEVGADEVVLVGLDGGGDVAHGADTGALDLAGDDTAALTGGRGGSGPGPFCGPAVHREPLVLQAGQIGGVALARGSPSEAAPDRDALWILGPGLVEGARDGGAPVDDEGRGGRVLDHAPPSHVVALPGVVAGTVREVEAPEEERHLGQFVQLLGLAAQLVSEHFGVGSRGGGVLADDDLFVGALDHRGEGGAAEVVVVAFLDEGTEIGGIGHRTRIT